MTENIRVYTDILNRYERPYRPMQEAGHATDRRRLPAPVSFSEIPLY